MSVFSGLWAMLFGDRRNVIRETAEIFRENSEQSAVRAHDLQSAALAQFATEFAVANRGGFDRFMDGLNRLPRPMLALGTLGLMMAAMVDPLWFAARMQGIALVPEPLWWLLGIVVSFYFGARSQAKTQAFQEGIARSLARVPQVVANLDSLNQGQAATTGDPAIETARHPAGENPALAAWRRRGAAA
ncbi:holin family protein [Tritonibacter horizontis]|uniref:Holin of 3TMs, for gene-transfer release n=1 Tax=Tritonibacter horizontis TaxID=1768241 RepID=A0A132BS93_9RHOB|nr:holin family protein [Tritonibacter horizontis]KUP90892.1 hypothetical protein TRIHO_42480 [Tritonibacter horizontis]